MNKEGEEVGREEAKGREGEIWPQNKRQVQFEETENENEVKEEGRLVKYSERGRGREGGREASGW